MSSMFSSMEFNQSRYRAVSDDQWQLNKQKFPKINPKRQRRKLKHFYLKQNKFIDDIFDEGTEENEDMSSIKFVFHTFSLFLVSESNERHKSSY